MILKNETFFLEIGTEEIPASYISPALVSLKNNICTRLADARISCGNVNVYGTPRRLTIQIEDVSFHQTSIVQELIGPPIQVAFKDGKPTVVAEKFSEKVGVSVNRLKTQKTEKGEYLYAKVTDRGKATRSVLADILPEAILSIYFPKRMRWAHLNVEFARPIRWILALFGEKIIPFTIGNLKSGRITYGHRFMSPGKIIIKSPEEYLEKLKAAFVFADINERRQVIMEKVTNMASSIGGKPMQDEALIDIVTQLVEFPVPVIGEFDDDFLALPQEILVCAMREHQKYFAVTKDNKQLQPYFIAINNTAAKDLQLVAKGHERVLRARLEDARFFYTADIREGFTPWQEKLGRVLFQAKLGTLAKKVSRIEKLVNILSVVTNQSETISQGALEAAKLCKADLMSHVVGEFASLQGIMGRIYAEKAGFSSAVAIAIEEHYRPIRSGGVLPETIPGALVAIADKLDTICGCFNAGLIPTGTADPYALRRQAIGIVQIMLGCGFSFSLAEMIQKGIEAYVVESSEQLTECKKKIISFFQGRIHQLLIEEGYAKDIVTAVLEVPMGSIPDIWKRTKALQQLKDSDKFEAVAATFKRVMNILRPIEVPTSSCVDEQLFEHATENKLYASLLDIRQKAKELLDKKDMYEVLLTIANIQPFVDAFFTDVMIMAKNPKIRENRLLLLKEISNLFANIADFSKIAV